MQEVNGTVAAVGKCDFAWNFNNYGTTSAQHATISLPRYMQLYALLTLSLWARIGIQSLRHTYHHCGRDSVQLLDLCSAKGSIAPSRNVASDLSSNGTKSASSYSPNINHRPREPIIGAHCDYALLCNILDAATLPADVRIHLSGCSSTPTRNIETRNAPLSTTHHGIGATLSSRE